jgi:hypothetical protein
MGAALIKNLKEIQKKKQEEQGLYNQPPKKTKK